MEEKILHQNDVEEVIGDEIEEGVGMDHAAVTNLVAISGGESPTEAEHNALLTRVNLLTQILRDNGIIAAS